MVSQIANFAFTILLTILASTALVLTYRLWVRPVLVRHNIFPLQHLPSTISQHLSNRRRRGHVRLPSEDFDEDPREWSDTERLGRDLEEGFGVYRDDDDEYIEEPQAEGVQGAGTTTAVSEQAKAEVREGTLLV